MKLETMEKNPPATLTAMKSAEVHHGLSFSKGYKTFLNQSNGAYHPVSGCYLYSLSEIAERNTTYLIAEDAPGFLLIGSDGGGRGILIKSGAEEIYMNDLAVIFTDELKIVAKNLDDFIQHIVPDIHSIDTSGTYEPNSKGAKDFMAKKIRKLP